MDDVCDQAIEKAKIQMANKHAERYSTQKSNKSHQKPKTKQDIYHHSNWQEQASVMPQLGKSSQNNFSEAPSGNLYYIKLK